MTYVYENKTCKRIRIMINLKTAAQLEEKAENAPNLYKQ